MQEQCHNHPRPPCCRRHADPEVAVSPDVIGWAASAVLLATVSRQVWKQWSDGSTQGVSAWLFAGQIAASTGFLAYSWMLGNWIFVSTNALMLLAAITGQVLYLRARKRHPAKPR
jgi:MtN3 and saliva related transmembrane protein